MAKETQRSFHLDRRVVEARVEDDLGVTHVVALSVHTERCPACQREYPKKNDQVDFDELVKQVCEEYSAEAERVIAIFEKHGADMSAHRARRAERLEGVDASHDPASHA